MKKIRSYKVTVFFVLFLLGIVGNGMCSEEKAEAAVNVVLDAGHDDTHIGARANNLEEEDLNLKIATYCYEELATYADVNLHMVRTGGACPFSAESNVVCNQKRVEFAKNAGASVYVSFHNNTAPATSARGVTVYYPNMSYRSDIGTAGQRLAQMVQTRLVELGLHDRGTAIRNSEDNTRYPDSSLADYYAIIKYSKLAGFPGIIIEHAFMTNTSDVEEYLNTDDKLKLLGIADAKAIAEYFGLVKHWSNFKEAAQLKTTFSNDGKSASVALSEVLNAPQVQFAVWTEENGQDDLVWYEASKSADDSWSVNISAANHKYGEKYIVHAYVIENGKPIFVKGIDFAIEKAQAVIDTKNVLYDTGVEVFVSNLPYVSDIESVKLMFRNKDDETTAAASYTMKPQQGGYKAIVSYSNHPENGTYVGQLYATMKNGVVLELGTIEVTTDGKDGSLTGEAVSVSGEAVQLLGKIYYPAQNTELYRNTKEQIPEAERALLQGFYIYEQQLLNDGDAVDLNGDFIVELPLPEGYSTNDVIIYGLEISGESIALTEINPVNTTEDGACQIKTTSLGSYVICLNQKAEGNGDVNFDGQVTLDDAKLVLQFALGIREYTQEELRIADVDTSGVVDLADANRVLRIALGIE